MKRISLIALVAILALSVNTLAQSCSDLTIGGTMVAGGDLSFSVTGNAPFAPVYLLGSDAAGTTNIGGVVTLGIVNPAAPFLTLVADAAGDASFTYNLPPMLPPGLVGFDIYVQAISLDFSGSTPTPFGYNLPFSICLSDVESFQLM